MAWVENRQTGDASSLVEAPLDSLISKVRNLTLRNQELESELELTRKKLAFYESFDESIQETMTHSLRLAFEVRAKSEQEAKELLESARQEERLLRGEVVKLTAERQALLVEREALHKSVEEIRREWEQERLRQDGRNSERSQLLSEVAALEDRLQSIRQELAPAPSAPLGKTVRQDPGTIVNAPAASVSVDFPLTVAPAPIHRVEGNVSGPAANEEPPAKEKHSVQGERFAYPPAMQASVTPVEAGKPSPQVDRFIYSDAFQNLVTSVEEEALPAQASSIEYPIAAFQTSILPYQEETATVEADEPVYSAPPQFSVVPIENEKPFVNAGVPISPAVDPVAQSNGEVELVVSPVHSFPKLVELERALQTLAEVKSFYVRDFRYGVATLLLKLISPERRETLPSKLEKLPGWNLVILSCPPHRIEARVEA